MEKNDRIFKNTRLVVALIIPFLIAAFIILYFFPDHTTQLFAWTINPRMTPLLMGAGYISGAYFFLNTLRAKRWHHVSAGFPAVAVFAAAMGLATLIHWDRFNHTHPSFFAWTILYATTPFIVLGVWLNNRRTDPGKSNQEQYPSPLIIPPLIRGIFSIMGAATLLLGLLLFAFPQTLIPFWPWELSPLTARVGGGWLAMPGVFAILIAYDGRWSAARLALESLALSFVLVLLAVPRAWDNFDPANPFTWVFVGGAFLTLLAIIALYILMESKRRSRL